MQKMKTVLMMFCLTVLLSCAALMMNTPTASAMTLNDLQGDYRVVGGMTSKTIGCVISLVTENGELVGKVKKVSPSIKWHVGQTVIQNIFVNQGTIYCQSLTDGENNDIWSDNDTMLVYNNGGKIKIEWHYAGSKGISMEMNRL